MDKDDILLRATCRLKDLKALVVFPKSIASGIKIVLSDITTITITINSYDISHDSRSITIMIFNFSLQQ